MLLSTKVNGQTKTINYISSNEMFTNPERGFYKHSSTHKGTYQVLSQVDINNYRLKDNVTLIYRNFNIDDFVNSPISSSYLTNMQGDFDKIRKAGLKCIIRFTYSKDKNASPRDASKAIILSHLQQLKPLLNANVDIICVVQAGFIGSWGEWFYTSQEEFGGWGFNKTNLTTTNLNNRKEIVNAILDAMPSSRMLQLRKPTFKQDLFTKIALTSSQAFKNTNIARIGHHNDCFLSSEDDNGTYDDIITQYPYLSQETKYLPMGGETCALNSPRTDCTSAITEMGKFHWSFLNLDFYPDVIEGFETNNCFADIQKKLGYRFLLNSATFPKSQLLGTKLPITLKITNTGFAAPFNERKAYLVLKNETTNKVYSILLTSDPRTWLGPNELTINESLTLPSNLSVGNYKLYLHLPDYAPTLSNRPEFAIRFANQNVWNSTTGFNDLNYTISVTDTNLGAVNSSKINMSVYPVPSNNELVVEFDGINDYQITLINSLGQNVLISKKLETNKVIINTLNLSEGLYFLEFAKGDSKETRKILIKH